MSTTVRPLRVESSTHPVRPLHSPRSLSLLSDIHGLCRRLLRGVPDLSDTERQFLKDVQRNRYPTTLVDRLVSITTRAADPSHKFGLPEIMRAHIITRSAPVRLVREEVLDAEDQSNSAADIAVRRYLACPTPSNKQAAREALEAQKAHTQLCLDWLNSSTPGAA